MSRVVCGGLEAWGWESQGLGDCGRGGGLEPWGMGGTFAHLEGQTEILPRFLEDTVPFTLLYFTLDLLPKAEAEEEALEAILMASLPVSIFFHPLLLLIPLFTEK